MAKRGGKRRDPAREKLWRRTIREQQRSGLSVRVFCEREGLTNGDFLRWRRELNRRDLETRNDVSNSATSVPTEPRASPTFLPVRVVDADHDPSRPAPPIEIVLQGGPTVRVPPGFDPRTLGDVLAVLEGRPC
jgi:transposase